MSDHPIDWFPDVCKCHVKMARENPSSDYLFAYKCEIHAKMDDADARADIVSLCADKSQIITAMKKKDIEDQIASLQEMLLEFE